MKLVAVRIMLVDSIQSEPPRRANLILFFWNEQGVRFYAPISA